MNRTTGAFLVAPPIATAIVVVGVIFRLDTFEIQRVPQMLLQSYVWYGFVGFPAYVLLRAKGWSKHWQYALAGILVGTPLLAFDLWVIVQVQNMYGAGENTIAPSLLFQYPISCMCAAAVVWMIQNQPLQSE